jgi:hypothetical protein
MSFLRNIGPILLKANMPLNRLYSEVNWSNIPTVCIYICSCVVTNWQNYHCWASFPLLATCTETATSTSNLNSESQPSFPYLQQRLCSYGTFRQARLTPSPACELVITTCHMLGLITRPWSLITSRPSFTLDDYFALLLRKSMSVL